MKKLITALVFILLVGGGVFAYYRYGRTEEKPQVIQSSVSRGPITETVQATGTLEALRTVNVGSQVSGTVIQLGPDAKTVVDYNSIVKAGEVIARLDPSLLETQVKVQQANIEKQQTDIDSNKVQLENDKLNLARTQQQFDAHVVSQQALDTAQLAVKTRDASIASAEKQLVTTRAALEQAQLNVEYCTIRSPIDGVVVQRQVDIGQTVQASMTTPQFFQLATDLTTLRLTAGVDEADIGKIRPGQDVNFVVDAYQGQTFRGKVDRVRLNATTSNNVVTYQVVANVANPELKLRPAMTTTAHIIIETSDNVLRVPNQALRFKPTADMYAALGAQAPTPPGRGGNAGVAGDPGGRTPGGNGANANAPAGQSAQNGQGGQGQNRRNGGGRGFGQGGTANLTPEQRQQMMNRFAGGGRGGGGRNGRNQPAANDSTTPAVPLAERATQQGTDKIDDLFAPLQRTMTPGTVYIWDEANKNLKRVSVMVGITDGQQSEIVSSELQPNTQIVTGIILPVSLRPTNGGNPLMGNQPRGGGGGMQPGGGGRGPGGGGRGGN